MPGVAVVRARQRRMLVRAPLVEAEQDSSIRIEDLTKVVMGRSCLGLAEERLVPFEATRHIAYADDRPGAFHDISPVGLTLELSGRASAPLIKSHSMICELFAVNDHIENPQSSHMFTAITYETQNTTGPIRRSKNGFCENSCTLEIPAMKHSGRRMKIAKPERLHGFS